MAMMSDREDDVDMHLVIKSIKEMGINCLAIDFDKTLISLHTEGKWSGEANPLVQSIRPIFQSLVPKAVESGIHVVVVTFSPQVKLIQDVLAIGFPKLPEIIVRGNDGTWKYTGEGSSSGKMAHIASAFEELVFKFGEGGCSELGPVTRGSTLLIDDDPHNVREAIINGTPSVLLNPQAPDADFISDLLSLPKAQTPIP